MVRVQVTSDRAQTVDGLAVFAEGETKVFTQKEMEFFFAQRGIPVGFDHELPGLDFAILTGGEE